MILQCNRRTEERHHPVSGELVDGTAVALYRCRREIDELGHHLAQSLRAKRRRHIHRPHHISEENCDLLVFGRLNTGFQGCTARIAEPRVLTRLRAARLARRR